MASETVSKTPAIAKDSLVLVTGVTGYIASHLADTLLARGYRVRGTARDASKARWVSELFEDKFGKGRFETTVVADMAVPGAFDEAVKGKCVAGVAHVASVLTFSPDPNAVIPQTIAGALNALSAAAKEPSVKRFVYTSSSVAATLPKQNEEKDIDENTWNDEVIPVAWAPPPYEPGRAYIVYAASKTQAERESWEFVRKNKPDFAFNSILPNAVFGQILNPASQRASTAGLIREVLRGDRFPMEIVPSQHYVDVKDTALLHVAALVDPEVRNERILAFAAPFTWSKILGILREARPDAKIPDDDPAEGRDITNVSNTRGEALLRSLGQPGWTSLESAIKDNLKGI
ncbi:hypothetical protein GP486_003895 [Trichoglossum hirsutum]|uniref:NAD-dependent epimerase/dehydratase domain-containing protein n=1 Tax=Trichoglossum hirsutum TaxID=265104 RepID=A0A9P8LCF0_9PEZI|nr:hypothetical protein GP486_003895 [Trichoglossum hirsutum]